MMVGHRCTQINTDWKPFESAFICVICVPILLCLLRILHLKDFRPDQKILTTKDSKDTKGFKDCPGATTTTAVFDSLVSFVPFVVQIFAGLSSYALLVKGLEPQGLFLHRVASYACSVSRAVLSQENVPARARPRARSSAR